ncbi:MAG TPA: leucine-rich repeat protein, partial [Verrucomicrobiae bacterium]
MQTITLRYFRTFIFLTMLLGLLAPRDLLAQSAIEQYIWPDQSLDVTSIGVEVPTGPAYDGISTLYDNFGFSILGAAGDAAGEAGDVLDVADTFYQLADQSQQAVQQLLALSRASAFTGWNVSGFSITTNFTSSGVPGAEFVSIQVLGYLDDNQTTGNSAAVIPDYITIPNPLTGNQSRPLPIESILNIGAAARISSLSIGSAVKTIAPHALDIAACTNFTAGSPYFYSLNGVLLDGNQTTLIRYPEALGGNYVVPSTVTNIAGNAFLNCSNLISVAIGSNVVEIGGDAFKNSGVQTVYFGGNAPVNYGNPFTGTATNCTVYYLPGFTGWGNGWASVNFGGTVASLYNPFPFSVVGNSVIITQFGGWNNPASATILIPSVINGMPVRSIAANAFSYQPGVTNIVIPDSVTDIGDNAFGNCQNLKNITLSTNLTGLGENAFQNCSRLTHLNIPNGVTVIPAGLVAHCPNLTTVTMGTNVTTIGYGAFDSCTLLFSLSLPATVNSIAEAAFSYCSRLRITVDQNNPVYSSDIYWSLFNKSQTELIHANAQAGGSYTVPNTVVNIDADAFYGADFSVVALPAGLASIGDEAFENCTNLAAIYAAGNAPTNGVNIFSGNTNVVYVLPNTLGWQTTYAGVPVKPWIPYGYATNNNSLTLTAYGGPGGNVVLPGTLNGLPVTGIQAGIFTVPGAVSSLTIPDGVTNIVAGAFSGLINLTNIVFGNNVISIGDNAFAGCSSLGNLVIPNSVKNIGSAAFSNCGITNLVIGTGVTDLADTLFANCQLPTVTIPANIIHIGASTFANNPLQSVVIPGNVASLGANAFANCIYLLNAYFQGNAPANDGTAFAGDNFNTYATPNGLYLNALAQYLPGTTGWKSSYGGIPTQVLPLYYSTSNGTITITNFAGSGRFPIFSAINGVPVTGIADKAFANCPGLTSVIIPAGITSIGTAPFMNCPSLTNLVVMAGNSAYVSISNVLFNSAQTVLLQYAGGLGGVYQVPGSVTSIGASAFYGSAVKRVTLPASVTGVGSEAFAFCRALTNLVVTAGNPAYVASGGVLFDVSRTSLVQFPGGLGGNYAIPASVTTLGPSAFAASRITSLLISNNVFTITPGALAYCTALTNIIVSAANATFASVNGVLENAAQTVLLQYPGGLTGSLTIGTNITAIGNLALAGSLLSSVIVPATVSSVGTRAFAGCAMLADFFGNAPANDGTAFANSTNSLVYFLASGTGWGSQYGGAPTQQIPFYIQDNGDNTLTVTGYFGTAPSFLAIPATIFGEPVSAIGDHAFDSQTSITTLSIPPSVGSIGEYAFVGCVRLGGVQFRNSGNLSVGYGAFQGCLSLKSVGFFSTAPATIGDYAFYG